MPCSPRHDDTRYHSSMEPLHITEGDLAKDLRSVLRRVETGAEVIIERDAQPVL